MFFMFISKSLYGKIFPFELIFSCIYSQRIPINSLKLLMIMESIGKTSTKLQNEHFLILILVT